MVKVWPLCYSIPIVPLPNAASSVGRATLLIGGNGFYTRACFNA
jgi:hypothetical protein